jgi:hypothetical protein
MIDLRRGPVTGTTKPSGAVIQASSAREDVPPEPEPGSDEYEPAGNSSARAPEHLQEIGPTVIEPTRRHFTSNQRAGRGQP